MNLSVLFLSMLLLFGLQPYKSKEKKAGFISRVKKIQLFSHYSDEEVYEKLWHFYQNPIDLNQTTGHEIEQLGILSEKQIKAFLDYRNEVGKLVSIYELQGIPMWDVKTIHIIRPFIKVSAVDCRVKPSDFLSGKQTLVIGFERSFFVSPGLKPSLGNPNKWLVKYTQQRLGLYRLAFLTKKSPGEIMVKPEDYWLPCWVANGVVENSSLVEKAVIGHYEVGFGQGLVLHSGFNMDKTADAVYVLRVNEQGLKPITSYSKKKGFQGFATALTKRNFTLTLYGSKRDLDARVYQDRNGKGYVRSVGQRGVNYYNEDRLGEKDALREQLLGAALTYDINTMLQLGVQVVGYEYDKPVLPRRNYYNQDFFRGRKGGNFGAFGRVLWQNTHFFTEVATCRSYGKAALVGGIISWGKWADMTFLWRYYTSDFHARYGGAFGRNSKNRNEHGLYIGMCVYPTEKVGISGYLDFFKHPKPQYRAHKPTQGTHGLLRLSYQPRGNVLYQVKIRDNRQPYNRSKVSRLHSPVLDIHQKNSLSLKFRYVMRNKIQVCTEAQLTRYNIHGQTPHHGLGAMQRISYKKNRTTYKAYFALFHAVDYTSRLYFYTPNILPGFKYPMLYGKGAQIGAAIAFPLTRKTNFKIQLALPIYMRKNVLHHKPTISLQLTYK